MFARFSVWFYVSLSISQTLVLILSDNVVRLNAVSPQLDGESKRLSDSKIFTDLNFLQLQMEILRLQEMLKNKQKSEENKSITTSTRAPKLTTTLTTKRPKTQSPKPNDEELDLKALQLEIETLQKRLASKISSRNENQGKDQTSAFPIQDNVNVSDKIEHKSQFRLFDDDLKDKGLSLSNITIPRSALSNYEYPSYGLMEYMKHHMDEVSEDSKNDYSEDKAEESDHKHFKSFDFDLIGGKKNGFIEYIVELFKLIIDGDGKGIVSVILKLPTIILKGIIQSATITLAKNGIKGVIIKVLVPLIAIVAINGILVFLVWWVWDDTSCHHAEGHKGSASYYPMPNYGDKY